MIPSASFLCDVSYLEFLVASNRLAVSGEFEQDSDPALCSVVTCPLTSGKKKKRTLLPLLLPCSQSSVLMIHFSLLVHI